MTIDDSNLTGHELLRLNLISAHRLLLEHISHTPIYSHDEIEVEKSLLAAQLQIEEMREAISTTWRNRKLPDHPTPVRPTIDDLLSL